MNKVCWGLNWLLVSAIATGCGGNDAAQAPDSPTAGAETSVKQTPKAPKPTRIRVENVGLSAPESILYDPQADLYLVSNINGSPAKVDDDGFISRIQPDGTVQELKWIDAQKEEVTLNAPKGMALSADTLFVADIDHVRLFDRTSGAPKGQIKVTGATFLNGMTIDSKGTVYVSDSGLRSTDTGFQPSGTDAIYRLQGQRAVPLIKDKALGNPNGIAADEDGLWVVTFGTGSVLRVNSRGKQVSSLAFPKGGLDGIVLHNNSALVSSWHAHAVYAVPVADLQNTTADAQFKAVVLAVNGPANIGFDIKRSRLLVPLFTDNAILICEHR